MLKPIPILSRQQFSGLGSNASSGRGTQLWGLAKAGSSGRGTQLWGLAKAGSSGRGTQLWGLAKSGSSGRGTQLWGLGRFIQPYPFPIPAGDAGSGYGIRPYHFPIPWRPMGDLGSNSKLLLGLALAAAAGYFAWPHIKAAVSKLKA